MLRPPFAVLSLAVLVLLFSFTPTTAQETTGNIEGRLVDSEGKPIAFANVNVTSPSLQGGRGVMSTSDGYFGVFKLPVGIYKVTISHVSYQQVIYEEVDVRLGRTTTLGKVTLASKTYEAPAVIVTEKKPLIDPTSTAIGANLVSKEFEDLPLDRDYQNMAALLPHANESYFGDGINFAGSPGPETKYFVDGTETTDPFAGVSGTQLPYNFVKEVQVKTGGYEAEYRSSLGGIVNVISHSGSNEIHGQAFGFFQNNEFSREPRLSFAEPPETDFTNYDVGVSLGGPVKRNKLWFFGAYNPSFVSEDVIVPGLGFQEDKAVRHIFAGKLTWRPTDRTNVGLTATGDPGTRDAVLTGAAAYENLEPVLADVTTGGVNLSIKGTHLVNDQLILEASVARITRTDKVEAATETGRSEVAFIDQEAGVASGGFPSPSDAYSVQTTADVEASYILGKHMLKAGLAFRNNQFDFSEDRRVVTRYNDSFYTELVFNTVDGSVSNRIPSAFVQDSWRITERLRINAGLRWDAQFLVGSDGEVAQKIVDQYQPRVGFVYQPGKVGTQKIFGSAGRFYQELQTAVANFIYNESSIIRFTAWDHDPRVDPSGGAVLFEAGGEIIDEVEGLEGQHYDEFTLGYERQVGERYVVGTRGIYRTLRKGIEDGEGRLSDGTLGADFTVGNPGYGLMSGFPKMKREYIALELTAQVSSGTRYNARASYVLSRNYGNYRGLFGTPNFGPEFDMVEVTENSTGYLNNDRTHVFKLSGSYLVGQGFSAGMSFWAASGTPLSIRQGSSLGAPQYGYAQQRGTADPYGNVTRTPAVWDLNFRFVYDLNRVMETSVHPRFIVDVFHVASQREPVNYDMIQNFNQDENGNQIDPNPTFGQPTQYQPPASVRVGVEVGF